MVIEIKVPSPGESITQVQIASWLVAGGQFVEKNTEIAEIESDKATLAISAPESGILTIVSQEGETVNVGQIIASIEVSPDQPVTKEAVVETPVVEKPVVEKPIAEAPVVESSAVVSPEKVEPPKKVIVSPLAQNIINQNKLDTAEISKKFNAGRILKKNVLEFLV